MKKSIITILSLCFINSSYAFLSCADTLEGRPDFSVSIYEQETIEAIIVDRKGPKMQPSYFCEQTKMTEGEEVLSTTVCKAEDMFGNELSFALSVNETTLEGSFYSDSKEVENLKCYIERQ